MSYAQQPLPTEQAFPLTVNLIDKHTLALTWRIAPGYYLYKDQVSISSSDKNQIKLGHIQWPAGIDKKDSIRGAYQIYSGNLMIAIPLEMPSNKDKILSIHIGYQGCSANGFCYTPVHKIVETDLSQASPPQTLTAQVKHIAQTLDADTDAVESILKGKSFFFICLTFLGLGLLLAFTPCVLPMVPILSGIIIGHRRHLTTWKTFFISLSYVLGMATSYAIAGVLIALIGGHLQASLQKPWIIIVFSAFFILLAFSLLGFYTLQLPSRWQTTLSHFSHRFKQGNFFSIFIMGAVSSLIISPCVSPPLVGVLAYVAETGNTWLGGTALFLLGMGMGIPLLIFGAGAGKLLPKSGPWLQNIETTMGFLMLAFAVWILGRILPGYIVLFLWGLLLMGFGITIGKFKQSVKEKSLWRTSLAPLILIYGIILIIGSSLGNHDPLHPWESSKKHSHPSHVTVITHMSQLDDALLKAKQEKKLVLLDFYADWCISCIRIEREIFTQPSVQRLLNQFTLLKIDVTNNNDFDKAVMARYNVIAPPTFLFFGRHGKRLSQATIVGEVTLEKMQAKLTKIIDKES